MLSEEEEEAENANVSPSLLACNDNMKPYVLYLCNVNVPAVNK